MPLPISD